MAGDGANTDNNTTPPPPPPSHLHQEAFPFPPDPARTDQGHQDARESDAIGDETEPLRPGRSLHQSSTRSPSRHSTSLSSERHDRQHHRPDEPLLSNRASVDMAGLPEEELALMRDDEEAGLTAKERRLRARQRRLQRRELDSSFDINIDEEGKRAADMKVIKKLAINVVLILLWYFFSLSISVYNKWMFSSDHLNFEYPLFTTSLHMAVQFILASIIIYFVPWLRPGHSSKGISEGYEPTLKQLISKRFYLTRLIPCGTATSLDIGLGNTSMRFITLTFVTMCKSSSLAFVLLFAFIFRLETPSWKLILIIASMTIGVVMMVAGETAFNAIGFALVIASAFFSGFRWGLTQILLLRHPATSNPFATLFLLTPIMFVTLILISFVVEGPFNVFHGLSDLIHATGLLNSIGLLVFPGVLAFCMIASEFSLLRRSSVVTLSICGIFKEVVTITVAGVIFDDTLTTVNTAGLAVTIGSIASYNYIKIARMRREARLDVAGQKNPDEETESEVGDDDGPELGQSSTNGLLSASNHLESSRSISPGLHTRATPSVRSQQSGRMGIPGSPSPRP